MDELLLFFVKAGITATALGMGAGVWLCVYAGYKEVTK